MDPAGVLAVVPARLASTRLPGKMLLADTGWPLIRHTWSRLGPLADRGVRVIVAVDASELAVAASGFGAEVMTTRPDHPNGTSRIAEVAARLGDDCPDIVVNVQGDEPELDPGLVEIAVDALADRPECDASTLACPFGTGEDPSDPAIVKVVRDRAGRALYFSRSCIPFDRDGSAAVTPLKHVGLYVYRRALLDRWTELEPTPLERSESLEQLRLLESGIRMAVAEVEAGRHRNGIDTPAQYAAFVERVRASGGPGAPNHA